MHNQNVISTLHVMKHQLVRVLIMCKSYKFDHHLGVGNVLHSSDIQMTSCNFDNNNYIPPFLEGPIIVFVEQHMMVKYSCTDDCTSHNGREEKYHSPVYPKSPLITKDVCSLAGQYELE